MVVIKGVKLYQNGEMREYSDLDIMQMMGRAVSSPFHSVFELDLFSITRDGHNLVYIFLVCMYYLTTF